MVTIFYSPLFPWSPALVLENGDDDTNTTEEIDSKIELCLLKCLVWCIFHIESTWKLLALIIIYSVTKMSRPTEVDDIPILQMR